VLVPVFITVVSIEHSRVTERIRSVGFDVDIVAVSRVAPVSGAMMMVLLPAAVTLFAGVPEPAKAPVLTAKRPAAIAAPARTEPATSVRLPFMPASLCDGAPSTQHR